MSQDENLTTSPEEEHDNLAELDGIGERYAAALAKAGVNSFSDLIKHTPKTLSEALRERAGVRISEKRIDSQNWIGQARQALGRKTLPIVSLPSTEEKSEEAQDPWEEHSTFQITFETRKLNGEQVWQTRVYDDRSGDEVPLLGVDMDAWANWILERAGFPTLTQEAKTETKGELEALQTDSERLQNERDALSRSLAVAEEQARQAKLQAETLERALQVTKGELETARTEAAQAKAEAESSAQSLKSMTQQAQAQIDAAFRVAVAAQGRQRPPEPAELESLETETQAPKSTAPATKRQQVAETSGKPSIAAGRSHLQVRIENVVVEGGDLPALRTGHVSFVIEGRQAPMVTRLAPCCVIEIRGVNPQGNTSILLARLEEPLSPNQFAYDVPFRLQDLKPGSYAVHTKLWLATPSGVITAVHQGNTIVQQSIAPSTSVKTTCS
jgi:hypothetical protein